MRLIMTTAPYSTYEAAQVIGGTIVFGGILLFISEGNGTLRDTLIFSLASLSVALFIRVRHLGRALRQSNERVKGGS